MRSQESQNRAGINLLSAQGTPDWITGWRGQQLKGDGIQSAQSTHRRLWQGPQRSKGEGVVSGIPHFSVWLDLCNPLFKFDLRWINNISHLRKSWSRFTWCSWEELNRSSTTQSWMVIEFLLGGEQPYASGWKGLTEIRFVKTMSQCKAETLYYSELVALFWFTSWLHNTFHPTL